MKSVLIVEDEKMIRKGICTIVKRSEVHIDEIIECRNGEEALDVLKEKRVDIMFTDIRMPKMDGITLIKEVQKLSPKPKIVVISGYDDFNYAVEVLKNGARDYILKPIEREKINSILEQLDKEIEDETKEKEKSESSKQHLQVQQLKYYLLNSFTNEKELQILNGEIEDSLLNRPYQICITNAFEDFPHDDTNCLFIDDVEEQSVFIVSEDKLILYVEDFLQKGNIGISDVHTGVDQLRIAYEESCIARKYAYIMNKHVYYYDAQKINSEEHEEIPKGFENQFVHKFGTDNMENAIQDMKNLFFKGRIGKIAPEKLIGMINRIWKQLYDTYPNVIDFDKERYTVFRQPLIYSNADEYLDDFSQWLEHMKTIMETEFDDYRNKEKINHAVAYIQENYSKDLNMAMVSNYVSMNYSLFSVTFKQYTGQNFVNYLKDIRLRAAKELLETTELKVIEISQTVGYDNEKHFMKLFKSAYGVSPTEYRKNIQIGKGNIEN